MAASPSKEELKRMLEAARAKADAAQAKADAARAKGDAARAKGDAIRAERDAIRAERDATRAEREDLQAEIDAARAEGDAARAKADAAQAEREELQQLSGKTDLIHYLDATHRGLYNNIRVTLDPETTTEDVMTSPQGKLVPAKIRQWDNFEDSQKQIWDTMGAADSDFFLERHFEPIIFLEIFGKRIRTCSISSEQDLTHATWDVIEYPVASIISKASEYPSIAKALLLKGSVMFPNRGNGLDDNADEVVERLKILEMATPIRNPRPDGSTGSAGSQSNGYTRANQICVYKLENKRQVPAFIITYKSPHRLTLDMISIGLRDMDNYNDIVNTVIVEEDPVTAHAKLEVAAAITEIFDYMVESRLQYGYVCTGLASIFLHIKTDDPTTVYYHLSIPREELREGTGQQAASSDPNLLHATAIGRVAIFDIQALQEKQLTNQWLDEAKTKLQRWEKDYVTMLRDIPETIRKDARSTPYKVSHPIKQSDVNSSPIWLRSKAAATKSAQRDPDADDLSPRGKSDKDSDNAVSNDNDSQDTCSDGSPCPPATSEPPSKRGTQIGGQRSYCTQQCLLGLLHGSQLDEQCPNVDEHRKSDGCRHDITQYKFLRRL